MIVFFTQSAWTDSRPNTKINQAKSANFHSFCTDLDHTYKILTNIIYSINILLMNRCFKIFNIVLCTAIICTSSCFADNGDCKKPTYRRIHPEKCKEAKSGDSATTIGAITGGVILGAGLMLTKMINTSADNGNTDNNPQQQTMRVYNMVGYTDPVALSNVLSDLEHDRNFRHYNEIRLAYSLARGFTGNGSSVAVLDTGDYKWHGTAVAGLVGDVIAPNAEVSLYKIVDTYGEFLSYREIGNIISSISDTNIFNSSWGISTTGNGISAYNIRTRAQLVALTDEYFVQSITNQAIENDAIFVWAAGNDGTKQSGALTAMGNVVPELAGHVVNVVAWDTNAGQIASYSNHCGVTKLYCITAPSSRIDVEIGTASGTSFAAPIVSGAIAVIQEAFPYMKATEITQLLFTTARDLGIEGVDEVYGWGMLDLERATRPVGAALVPLADSMMPLAPARVSGSIGQQLQAADLEFTFFDSFGRAFNTKLNDNISFVHHGRALERLQSNDPVASLSMGNIEFGFSNDKLIQATGFLQTDTNNLTSFVGFKNDFNIGNILVFQNMHIGIGAPNPAAESLISNFSTIYSIDAALGIKWQNWTMSVGVPKNIIAGKMSLRLPTGKSDMGAIQFTDHDIDLATRPAMEYSIDYNGFTMAYVDNPTHKDEMYILLKTRFAF